MGWRCRISFDIENGSWVSWHALFFDKVRYSALILMIMRIRLLVLFAIVTFQSGLAQSTFGDSVFNLVLQGKITAFDTLYTPVSKSRLFKRYLATDTVMTEFWMRPRFVDNVYLAFPWIFSDGQCFNRGFEFDTVTFGANTDYVAFYQETIHPLTGDYTGNEFGFLVNRNDKPLSSIEALESAM